MSSSKVVIGTSMLLVQAWPCQPGAPSAAAMKAVDAVDTVGLSGLSLSATVPGVRPSATASIVTAGSRP
jgi:hypothetical protein